MYDTLLPGHAAPYVCKYSPTSSIRLTSSNNLHAIVQIFIIPLCSECHISIAQDSDLLQFYKFASSGSARQETVNLPLSALRWLNGAHFFSFWRNLSDDDVCVQRNAFCAVKALPQNAQIFIAKKKFSLLLPRWYRFGLPFLIVSLGRRRLSLDQSFWGCFYRRSSGAPPPEDELQTHFFWWCYSWRSS